MVITRIVRWYENLSRRVRSQIQIALHALQLRCPISRTAVPVKRCHCIQYIMDHIIIFLVSIWYYNNIAVAYGHYIH